MSRFQVSQVDGSGGGGGSVANGSNGNAGIDNPAMDPVELNVYGLYSKRNSVTCPVPGELKRKSSYGFTHITRLIFWIYIYIFIRWIHLVKTKTEIIID